MGINLLSEASSHQIEIEHRDVNFEEMGIYKLMADPTRLNRDGTLTSSVPDCNDKVTPALKSYYNFQSRFNLQLPDIQIHEGSSQRDLKA
jgi:hypothetical protein